MAYELTPEMLREEVVSTRHPSGASFEDRLIDRLDSVGECLIYRGTGTDTGHGQMSLRTSENVSLDVFVHRAAWVLAHGSIPEGLEVLHRCDENRCCNADHLFLGTKKRRGEWMTERGHNPHTRCPERMPDIRGDNNPSRKHPERIWWRGDKAICKLHPHIVKRGETNHCAKIADRDVVEIRRLARTGMRQRDIAARYGIQQSNVSLIVQRKTWAHVPDDAIAA